MPHATQLASTNFTLAPSRAFVLSAVFVQRPTVLIAQNAVNNRQVLRI
jgi:hypothetical protein